MRAPTALRLALLPLVLGACREPTGTPPAPDQLLVARWMVASSSVDLFLTEVQGAGAVNLTGTPDEDEGTPAWSRDGRRIAFVRSKARHTPAIRELWVMRADGTEQVRITQAAAEETMGWPTWSPDGTRIAVPIGGRLMVVPVAGGVATAIDTGLRSLEWPSWSPDGSSIAFEALGDSSWNVYTVRPDGSSLTRISPTTADDGTPEWSPDGTRLAISRSEPTGTRWAVFTVNPDGSSPVRVTSPVDHSHVYPTWSPDGRRIAYVVMGREVREGMIVHLDGSAPDVSLGRVAPGRLAWRP